MFISFLRLLIQEAEAIYTHHQKTVIVDVDAGHHMRKIVAFVGGLDLCKGRYDTPGHSLYTTLKTVHSDDFHNPNFTVIIYLMRRFPLLIFTRKISKCLLLRL